MHLQDLINYAEKRWPDMAKEDVLTIDLVPGDHPDVLVEIQDKSGHSHGYEKIRLEAFKDPDGSVGYAGYGPESKVLAVFMTHDGYWSFPDDKKPSWE